MEWKRNWKDYYKILQVAASAEKKDIEDAYKKLSLKYHPDTDPDNSTLHKKMIDLNEAKKVLLDTEKRRQYDQEWHRKSCKHADSGRTYTPSSPPKKPVPVVEPTDISFGEVSPGKIQKASFVIRNIGGPYKKFCFSDPKSWVWVTRYTSLTTDDELPLKVEIESKGKDWGRSYSESIRVKLDEEETRIIITLKTRPKPVITVPRAIAGVGISVLILVSIIVSTVGRNNAKYSQSKVSKVETSDMGNSSDPLQHSEFEPTSFSVIIDSSPSGAIAFIDNKQVGIAPLSIKLEKGPHGIYFKKEGYTFDGEILEVEKGVNSSIYKLKEE